VDRCPLGLGAHLPVGVPGRRSWSPRPSVRLQLRDRRSRGRRRRPGL